MYKSEFKLEELSNVPSKEDCCTQCSSTHSDTAYISWYEDTNSVDQALKLKCHCFPASVVTLANYQKAYSADCLPETARRKREGEDIEL